MSMMADRGVTARYKPCLRARQQQRQLLVGVRRPDVLDPRQLPTLPSHELHRDRTGSRPDLAHEPRNDP